MKLNLWMILFTFFIILSSTNGFHFHRPLTSTLTSTSTWSSSGFLKSKLQSIDTNHLSSCKFQKTCLLVQSNHHDHHLHSKKSKLFCFVNQISLSCKSIVIAAVITFFSSTMAWARPDTKSSSNSLKEQQELQRKSTLNKNKSNNPSKFASVFTQTKGNNLKPSDTIKSSTHINSKNTKNKVKVDFIIEENDYSSSSKLSPYSVHPDLLNKIGVGIVGITVLGTLLQRDDRSISKKKSSKFSSQQMIEDAILKKRISANMDAKSQTKTALYEKLKKSYGKFSKLPDMNDMFKSEASNDLVRSMKNKLVSNDSSIDETKETKEIKETKKNVITSKTTSSIPTPTSIPAPIPVPQKKGFFDRIFKRAGDNRPTLLVEAIRSAGDPSFPFRISIVECLVNYIPKEYFDDWRDYYTQDVFSEDSALEQISNLKETSNLSPQEAADAFADVANAMLVRLIDDAVYHLDAKDDKSTITSLDIISDFVAGAGSLFGKLLSQVTIEPVQYNGKVKKGKLESLYYVYAKHSMSLSTMLAATGLGGGSEISQKDDSSASGDDATKKLEKLGRVQQVLGIKESKRNSIDQKVLREALMSEGAAGDLGNLFESFKGQGGNMADMLGGMPGMPNIPGVDEDLTKELENMKPEDIAEMSKSAMSAVKASLQDGSVTRKDVEELEKVMGIDVRQLAKMMESGQVDKSKLAELGPDYAEMLKIFKELAAIK